MSLANIIVQPDCAYLVTDSGHFSADGKVMAFGPKAMVLADLSIAIATTGSIQCGHIAREMPRDLRCTQMDFIRGLKDLVRAAYVTAAIDPIVRPSFVMVAFYSHERHQAGGLIFWTAQEVGPDGMQPWHLYPATDVLMPDIDRRSAFGREVDLRDPLSFNPERDIMPIIDAQRRPRDSWLNGIKGSMIAGDIDVTAVSHDGINVTTIHSYPDRVGEPAGAIA